MSWVLAVAVFAAGSAGIYLLTSRDLLRCVLGLTVLGSAANLVLFAAGGLQADGAPVVPQGATQLVAAADPLPQALVLTAIVISFALLCFSLVLVLRLIQRAGTDDALALRAAEPVPDDPVKPPPAVDPPASTR
jgi:multicomponent Na+:H+ antiporter subunit C